jgi:hypothetical protein
MPGLEREFNKPRDVSRMAVIGEVAEDHVEPAV